MSHFATTVALIGIVIIVASLLSGALERRGVPLVAAFLGARRRCSVRGASASWTSASTRPSSTRSRCSGWRWCCSATP